MPEQTKAKARNEQSQNLFGGSVRGIDERAELEYVCYFDGSITRNPGGTAGYGVIIKDFEGREVFRESTIIGSGDGFSCNVAEYAGLIRVLMWLRDNGARHAVVYGDSQMVISQMRRWIRAKPGKMYVPLNHHAIDIVRSIPCEVEFKWVPREENAVCDAISR